MTFDLFLFLAGRNPLRDIIPGWRQHEIIIESNKMSSDVRNGGRHQPATSTSATYEKVRLAVYNVAKYDITT